MLSYFVNRGRSAPDSMPAPAVPVNWGRTIVISVSLICLVALLAERLAGFSLDAVAALRYPFGLEYGEGLVWQQASLIPGPLMYGNSRGLPFIVFEYPPLYHLLTRAALWVQPDFLAAGRLVSVISAATTALSVAALVWLCGRRGDRSTARVQLAIAVASPLLMLCLPQVHRWSHLMRVDMAAAALGMAGLLVAVLADGRRLGTTMALLLCVASMFTKQTQLPFGVAVFVVALRRDPRGAVWAAGVAGSFGIAALALLEDVTAGGFLHHIIGYNINRFYSPRIAFWGVFWPDRDSFPFIGLMLVAAATLGLDLRRERLARESLAGTARAMLLLAFVLANLMLVTTLKHGASSNYLIDWLCLGGALIGVLLCDLVAMPWRFSLVAALLILALWNLPFRDLSDADLQQRYAREAALVQRIAAAQKPVASDDISLLLRAGKGMLFEPAIVTELALLGKWDETPLVKMIRSHGFAFMVTGDDFKGGGFFRRTPGVDAAMRQAYPLTEQIAPDLWLHLPAGMTTGGRSNATG